MPGVPRELIEHSLNVHPQAMPKKQRLQRFAHDKREAININGKLLNSSRLASLKK
jgi:hypothetical protein